MPSRPIIGNIIISIMLVVLLLLSTVSCTKDKGAEHNTGAAAEVTVVDVAPSTIPLEYEFIGQTESSRQVEIRARVDGFLEKRAYEEGSLVKEGAVMFVMDKKPFEASLQQAKGDLAQQEAKLTNAKANLARIKPLADKNAMSKKDLDDAVASELTAQAAVITSQGKLREAELNLSYATITTPVTGVSSKARKQEGSYISSADNLLTTVAQLHPIYVNFSISENDILKMNENRKKGIITVPPKDNFTIEIVLADGRTFPNKGKLNFAEPSFNSETGTFLVRAEIANPKGELKPGQFVRVKVLGANMPNAIRVPQRSVLQTAKGNIVFIVDEQSKAQIRPVSTGDLIGDNWIIKAGLQGGEKLVVDGAIKLSPGAPVKIVTATSTTSNSDAAQKDTTTKKTEDKPKK